MDSLLALLLLGAASQPIQKPVDAVEKNCLAANIYYEARGESEHGQKAVAAVTLNRVKSKKYPKTVCGVVMQSKQFSWSFQRPAHEIKLALTGIPPSTIHNEVIAYRQAQELASEALLYGVQVLPSNVMNYHTHAVNPSWNKSMVKVAEIGQHVFFREK